MQELVNYLRAIAGGYTAEDPGYSLCYLVSKHFSEHKRTFNKALYTVVVNWKHFSGDFEYPICHPSRSAAEAYKHCNKYNGEYGNCRRELAGLIAEKLARCYPNLY